MKRRPRHAKPKKTEALVPEVLMPEPSPAATEDARLEAALAEALTGGDLTAAARAAGLSKTAFQKAIRAAERDEYAVVRDHRRLKVINDMYSALEAAVARIVEKLPDAEVPTLMQIIDKMGLRISCLENNRISLAEELSARSAGVSRIRTISEELRVKGNLSPADMAVVDKLLGTGTLPSAGLPAPAHNYQATRKGVH